MKRILLLLTLMATVLCARAAYLENVPTTLIQPNGDTLLCLQTGDEYYHRLHDEAGFTIVQNRQTGWYVYAQRAANGRLEPSTLVATTQPQTAQLQTMGIVSGLMPPAEELRARAKAWEVPERFRPQEPKDLTARNRGTINNLVIFIRFADESSMDCTFSQVDQMFNDSSANSTSQYAYFREASYGKLSILSHFYPQPNGNTVLSYQDSLPRCYFQPYSASNPNGYTSHAEREFSLLQRCVNWINANNLIPTSLNLDADNDGYIDNVVFVVSGTYTGWSDLLWPHKWSLYDRYVYINGKRLYTFNLQLAGSGSHYFSSSTLCHEMFHTLGAPDLYRYSDNSGVSTAGNWDLMHNNSTPPQHMSAWMKLKYGNWLDSIPDISYSGTYTLRSLAEQNDNDSIPRALAIPTGDPNQYWVLEYRDNTERFETALPGSGLLIWRVDTRYDGNASFDTTRFLDEVYLMRPNGTNMVTNGSVNSAHFGQHVSRPTFSLTSNPSPWINPPTACSTCLGIPDSTIQITNIVRSADNSTISFNYIDLRSCMTPDALTCTQSTNASARLAWNGRGMSYRVQWREHGTSGTQSMVTSNRNAVITGLQANTHYEFRVCALCSATDSSDWSGWSPFFTLTCAVPQVDTIGTDQQQQYTLPVNTYYNYSLTYQIVRANEIGSAMQLTALEFLYDYATAISSKTNCTIYVGHTSLNNFASTSTSAQAQTVSVNSLTKVYEGPMNCTQGWNRFGFSQPFDYNGTDNLLIVIDDNSGAYNTSSFKFAQESTTDRMSFAMFSDSDNPDATNPTATYSGNKAVYLYRAVMQLVGCDASLPPAEYEITVASNEETMGSVSGGGIFTEGDGATLTATANEHYHFAHWTGPDNFFSTDNPLQVLVLADAQYTAHFQPDTFCIEAICVTEGGNAYGSGNYAYGSTATLYFSPIGPCHRLYWEGPDNTVYEEDTLHVQVTCNATYQLYMARDSATITLLVSDPDMGMAEGAGRYPTVTYVDLTAIPAEGYNFILWTDGEGNEYPNNPLRHFLLEDITFTASFARDEGIEPLDAEPIIVLTQGLTMRLQGANGMSLRVSDLLGRTHHQTDSYDGRSLRLPHGGVYLLQVGDRPAQKVVLR